jgi:hypothetical protein
LGMKCPWSCREYNGCSELRHWARRIDVGETPPFFECGWVLCVPSVFRWIYIASVKVWTTSRGCLIKYYS